MEASFSGAGLPTSAAISFTRSIMVLIFAAEQVRTAVLALVGGGNMRRDNFPHMREGQQ